MKHDYPNINKWMKNLYWNYDAFKSTTNFDHIKTHYYWSHPQVRLFIECMTSLRPRD